MVLSSHSRSMARLPATPSRSNPGRPLQVIAEAQAREPIDRIEVVANGRVVADCGRAQSSKRKSNRKIIHGLPPAATLKTGLTIRLAHTSPIYLRGEKQTWDAAEDKAYFVKWIDDLIAESEADPKRFANVDQKNEVLAIYKTARDHYLG